MSFLAFSQSSSPARVPDRITEPINEGQLVTLPGNTHPSARSKYDKGIVDDTMPMERLILMLQRGAEQQLALNAMAEDLHNPKSPNFHQWLTPEEFGRTYGPSESDIGKVTAWLEAHGFKIDSVASGRTHIVFSGTAGQIRDAFHTEIHNYTVNGVHHTANVNDPRIPAALSPL